MAKASLSHRSPKPPASSSSRTPNAPVHVPDVFSAQPAPSHYHPVAPQPRPSGEIERIRQQLLDDGIAQSRQAEDRRPDYLKRSKRSLQETEQSYDPVMDFDEREGPYSGVGIMESPMKGRRLKLFQETSEESFEESLMTGGYERYRNANPDWIHQSSPGPTAQANIEPVLTEKEVKKQKRLAAFGELFSGVPPPSKLLPVNLDGRGRVLLDPQQETISTHTDSTPSKKKIPRRKKKATPEAPDSIPGPDKIYLGTTPDWPDAQFPWSLRLEEQTSQVRATQEDRLKWIKKFLDRDSDEEDEDEDEEILPSNMWGQIYEDAPMPSRRGRGKMIGLPASPRDGSRASMAGTSRRRAFFPSDPADAKAALLSKRSVRMLSYRSQPRVTGNRARTWEEDSDDDETCYCGGRNTGQLVQCDSCETGYHLGCIGVTSIKDLGKEGEPWFCAHCVSDPPAARTPSPELMIFSSEPTFVPTDERRTTTPSESLFYQSLPLPASPASPWQSSRPPSTPVRGGSNATFSSGSSSVDPGKHESSTPHLSSHSVRIHPHEPLGPDGAGFDPTSTPSRGITFGAPFATPKNALWSNRANGMFQTPLRAFEPSNRSHFGGLMESGGTLPSFSPYRPHAAHDDLPVRGNAELSKDTPKQTMPRRLLDSPAFRFPYAHLQESPVVRSKASHRGQETLDTAYMEIRGSVRQPAGPTPGSAH
ncbi:hypothetical protein HWV62_38500 [Athelia sp. TMB]|nr:hypothetical protein HWV62_38500 [Athelia sp. TMB]